MSGKITISEFKKYYEESKPSTIYFLTSDQEWADYNCSFNIKIIFHKIVVFENPKLVYFLNDYTQLCINQIKHIHIDAVNKKYPALGNVLSIICTGQQGEDIIYKFLIS